MRASKLAGLEKVPVLVRNYTDAQVTEIALIENLQRCDLNAIEEAEAYDRLLTEFGLTQEILAQKVGRSRSHIANFFAIVAFGTAGSGIYYKWIDYHGAGKALAGT